MRINAGSLIEIHKCTVENAKAIQPVLKKKTSRHFFSSSCSGPLDNSGLNVKESLCDTLQVKSYRALAHPRISRYGNVAKTVAVVAHDL